MRVTWNDVAADKGFQSVYKAAASYVEPLGRKARVLDLGGGIGQFGSALAERSPDLDYVNVELNPDDLKESPGTGIREDTNFVYELLKVREFDAVALLNYKPCIDVYRIAGERCPNACDMPIAGLPQFLKPMTYAALEDRHQYIDIITASLLLRNGGRLLFSRLSKANEMEEIKGIIEYFGLPLGFEFTCQQYLDEETARKFMMHDTAGRGMYPMAVNPVTGVTVTNGVESMSTDELVGFYRKNYALHVFRCRNPDRMELKKQLQRLREGQKAYAKMFLNPNMDDDMIMDDR